MASWKESQSLMRNSVILQKDCSLVAIVSSLPVQVLTARGMFAV
jgi:hypothetical protein